jgi:hypothetical protein
MISMVQHWDYQLFKQICALYGNILVSAIICLHSNLPFSYFKAHFKLVDFSNRNTIRANHEPIKIHDCAEKGEDYHQLHVIGRARTKGGYLDDCDQPSLLIVHRSSANPAPLGLLSLATGVFLFSLLSVYTCGVQPLISSLGL